MTTDFDSVKAILDSRLSDIRFELQRMANNYDSLTKTVQNLENRTSVEIAKIEKDVTNVGGKVDSQSIDIKAIKSRIEIGEDVQQEKWAKQEVINSDQKTINENAKTLSGRIVGVLFGAVSVFIGLLINYFWQRIFP